MSDHQQQRIYPAPPDVEAPPPALPPSAPLIPPNTAVKSDNNHPPPPPPPPLGRRRKSKRSCCCRVFCCIFCLLLVLIIAIGATVGILFLVFHPKIPKYSLETLKITRFSLLNNNSLSATFHVNITAHNPNKHIGIYYLGGSQLSAWYQDTLLCDGALPAFYQGHRNTTVIDVPMTGTVSNATGFSATLQEEQSRTGNIPLVLRGRVPVKVKLGKLKLMKMRFRVRCLLTIHSFAANKQIRIASSTCKFKLKHLF